MQRIIRSLSKIFTAGLSRRIVFWVFISVIAIETIIFFPSLRNREREFAAQDVDAAELNEQLSSTVAHARDAVARLTLADLEAVRQVPGRNSQRTVSYALLHALEHAGQHLAHAQITRQLWDQHNA